MAKARSVFVCQQCGNESPKWLGRCPGCGEWNSMAEMKISATQMTADRKADKRRLKPQKLSQIKSITRQRIKTGIEEFDRVLGGGVVPGSVVLVAGEPGIGKSTLMLQVAAAASPNQRPSAKKSAFISSNQCSSALYVTGEESLEQIKLRAQRLGLPAKSDLQFLAETDADSIASTISNQQSAINNLAIIDSIQTLQTDDLTGVAGSVGQVRECANKLLKIGKSKNIPIFLVGHVTKAGAIAGPKVLEHMVDTVLYFEGERFGNARLLRTTKNRYGATDEVGIFEMTDKGLREVKNPSKLFLRERQKKAPGSVVVAAMEGTRPILTEVQALAVPTQLAIPRRVGRGVDYNRLQLIVAVLSKQLRLPLGSNDIFVNVAGGLKIEEPAADLAIALAIVSSFKNIALDEKLVAFGELGLLGEVRQVTAAEKRAKEARRLGFTTVISPVKFSTLGQLARVLFKK
ncbi:DNA repair protein RadA [Patescibacteria group bacterium]